MSWLVRSKLRRSVSAIIRLKKTNTKSCHLSGKLHRLNFIFPAENEILPRLQSVVIVRFVVPILSGRLNEYRLYYVCCECVIAIWRLRWWHPLVARNYFFPSGWASMLTVPHPLDLILRLDSVYLKPKWPPVKIGDSVRSRGEPSVIWGVRKLSIKHQGLIKNN